MKLRRQKNARRVLNYFKVEFGIQEPYSVLLDATFCRAALRCKLNISEQLPKYLNSRVHFFTTQCVLNECESFGSLLYGVLKVLQQFQVEPCVHNSGTTGGAEAHSCLTAADCILATVKRRRRPCVVATNDREVTEQLREMRNVPLLFVSHNAISIEKPSGMRSRTANADNSAADGEGSSGVKRGGGGNATLTDHERKQLKALYKREFPEREKMMKIRTKLKRLKERKKARSGPNPLSCKKKKTKTDKPNQKSSKEQQS